MDIRDLKFTEEMFEGKDISSMPDSPSDAGISAGELKAWFDAVPKMMVALGGFNNLIDALTSVAGAANIGLEAAGVAAANVNEGIAELRETTYTKNDVDVKVADLENDINAKVADLEAEFAAQFDAKADKASVLTTDNSDPFTPTGDYQPATKRYVDLGGEGGDVTKLYVDEQDAKLMMRSATKVLKATSWTATGDEYTQTISVVGIRAQDMIHQVAPDDAGRAVYIDAGVYALRVTTNDELTFRSADKPASDITVNVTQIRNWGNMNG